jgi:hypothetical protein
MSADAAQQQAEMESQQQQQQQAAQATAGGAPEGAFAAQQQAETAGEHREGLASSVATNLLARAALGSCGQRCAWRRTPFDASARALRRVTF